MVRTSKSDKKPAMWMLDTEGRNLKAEVDEELFEAIAGQGEVMQINLSQQSSAIPFAMYEKTAESRLNRDRHFFTRDERVKEVNQHGGLGIWHWSVSKDPADIAEILEKASEI